MGMTIAEKILAAKAGKERVRAGEFVSARADFALANDITAPLAIKTFSEIGIGQVFDPARIALVPDHSTPNKDIASAEQARAMREFARAQGILHYYEVGRAGIAHALLPEQGLVVPGDLVVGADSHTCTYGALGCLAVGVGSTDLGALMATGDIWLRVPETIKITYSGKLQVCVGGKDLILHTIGMLGVAGANYQAIEFDGPVVRALPMAGRFTMCNMAVEAGAKAGIISCDEVTSAYLQGRAERSGQAVESDPDAEFAAQREVDVSLVEPQVALPHSPANVVPMSQVPQVPIDQVVIGSCTNGWLEDLREAGQILRGRTVHPRVRLIVIPATQKIFAAAVQEGIAETVVKAGGVFSTPTCGPCLGGHMGVLGAGERCVSTTNRNFVGRMGHATSEVYLANPAVAAASAILGRIAHPAELM